jgi:hypothetical protein
MLAVIYKDEKKPRQVKAGVFFYAIVRDYAPVRVSGYWLKDEGKVETSRSFTPQSSRCLRLARE